MLRFKKNKFIQKSLIVQLFKCFSDNETCDEENQQCVEEVDPCDSCSENETCEEDFIKKATHFQVYDPRIRPAGQNSTGGVFYHFSIFSLFFSFSFFSATIQF